MAGQHGGKRPGAGRPKKQPPPAQEDGERTLYEDAEAYLTAVVEGREPPDPLRIQAAKALLAYQKPKRRAPVKSPRPSELAAREELSAESAIVEDFAQRARAIRAKHGRH